MNCGPLFRHKAPYHMISCNWYFPDYTVTLNYFLWWIVSFQTAQIFNSKNLPVIYFCFMFLVNIMCSDSTVDPFLRQNIKNFSCLFAVFPFPQYPVLIFVIEWLAVMWRNCINIWEPLTYGGGIRPHSWTFPPPSPPPPPPLCWEYWLLVVP